jgi:AcrR family transcriptional regulator
MLREERKMDVESETSPLNVDYRYHRIIQCATEAFLANGYAGTSVEDIAIMASVSKPTIYKMIGDKYDLAKAVLLELASSFENDCRRAIDLDATLETCLLKFAMAYISWMNWQVGKTNNYGCVRLLVEMSSQHPEIPEMWVDLSRKGVSGVLSEYIKKRIELGDFMEEDPLFIAAQFIRTIYYASESIMAKDLYVTDISQTRRKIRMFLRGATSRAYRVAQVSRLQNARSEQAKRAESTQ